MRDGTHFVEQGAFCVGVWFTCRGDLVLLREEKYRVQGVLGIGGQSGRERGLPSLQYTVRSMDMWQRASGVERFGTETPTFWSIRQWRQETARRVGALAQVTAWKFPCCTALFQTLFRRSCLHDLKSCTPESVQVQGSRGDCPPLQGQQGEADSPCCDRAASTHGGVLTRALCL